MNQLFENLKNIIDFYLREFTQFSRSSYSIKTEDVNNLLKGPSFVLELELAKKYELALMRDETTKYNYMENLYTLNFLDRKLPITYKKNLKVLDLGCKNWFYAKGEYTFFKKYTDNLEMVGVEIDAHRLYADFYSRLEVAKFNIKNLSNVRYIAKDFLKINEKFDYIIWILPFLNENSHIRWGLPRKLFNPKKLLIHAINALEIGGKLFIMNQGFEEFKIQKSLLDEIGVEYIEFGEIESCFITHNHKRYGLVVVR